jgi:hypothetical protein
MGRGPRVEFRAEVEEQKKGRNLFGVDSKRRK